MIEKFKISYQLILASFKFIKRDGELFVYGLISFVASAIVFSSLIGVGIINSKIIETLSENEQMIYGIIGVFLFYLVFSFIAFFFNTAVITSVDRRLKGQDNKFGDGIRDSMKHLSKIFQWSMIFALVATILKIIESRFGEDSIVGKIVVRIIGGAWSITTFFTFPIMILHNKGPKDAIKDSASLFKKTWGERAIIHVGVGLLFILYYFFILGLAILIRYTGNVIPGIIFLITFYVIGAIISGICDTIIKTILLQYATTGEAPAEIGNTDILGKIAGEKKK